MNPIFNYTQAPIIITSLLLIIVGAVTGFFIHKINKTRKEEEEFLEQLKYATAAQSIDNFTTKKENIAKRWSSYWADLLKRARIVDEAQNELYIGLGIIIISMLVWVVLTIIFRSFEIGILPAILTPIAIKVVAQNKIKARQKEMNEQIPAFIAALKSNIQANSTPERALIEAVDMTSSPLYEELKIAKAYASTTSLSTALERLRTTTASKDLRFLCACIEISAKIGTNLEDQLDVIEKTLEDKKELETLLDKAVRENRPLVIVSAILLPGLFSFMYLVNQNARDFWFKSLLSWAALIIIFGTYGGALMLCNHFIHKLDDLQE